MLKVLSLIAGTVLIVVGIVGILLPILHGVGFILAGLALIGYANPRVRDALERHFRRAERYVRSVWARVVDRVRRR
jgi:uncharacterized membrane protein YbaN (DUF454 family)